MSSLVSILPNLADWPVSELSAVTSMIRRGTAPVYVDSSEVLAIGQRCVTRSDFDASASRPHSSKTMTNVVRPCADDVLVNSTGTGTIGRSVVFPDTEQQFIVDGHVTVVRPQPFKSTGVWINEVLRSPWGQAYLESHCYAGSTNQIELASSALASTQVAVPRYAEQCRISEIIDTLNDQIRSTKQIVDKLLAVQEGLVVDLLTFGIDESGALRDFTRNPERFYDSSIGRVPVGWDVAGLSAYGHPVRPHLKTGPFGSSLKQEHWADVGVPVVTIGSLGDGFFIDDELLYVSESTANRLTSYALHAGDIVFSRVADVGRSVVIGEREEDWIMSSNMMWISVDPRRADPRFVRANIATNPNLRSQIRRYVNSAGRDVANAKIMNLLQFPWPPLEEQAAIADMIAASDERVATEQSRLAKQQACKDGIVADLLTGRVRVHVESA